ncbi:MAG: hypothetical protein ACT6RD_15400 [Brevundimonas sp.]|uniref:hypothetical protein n=1 Tax=Niveispirillum sp. TaxID=1917217 RepID=UPI0040344584
MNINWGLALSVWGSALATGLAALKIWEVWRDRVRLSTSYSFSSSPDYGDTSIIVENPSAIPVLVTYWELFWAERLFGWTLFERGEAYPEEGYCNITIGAHNRHQFDFSGSNWFKTVNEIDGRRVKLYLRLYVAGRKRPLRLLAWKPD